jgi:hypothetical protein
MPKTTNITAAGNAPRLTKLERFVANNPDMPFEVMAGQLNRTPGAMERAYDRLEKKLKTYRAEVIAAGGAE